MWSVRAHTHARTCICTCIILFPCVCPSLHARMWMRILSTCKYTCANVCEHMSLWLTVQYVPCVLTHSRACMHVSRACMSEHVRVYVHVYVRMEVHVFISFLFVCFAHEQASECSWAFVCMRIICILNLPTAHHAKLRAPTRVSPRRLRHARDNDIVGTQFCFQCIFWEYNMHRGIGCIRMGHKWCFGQMASVNSTSLSQWQSYCDIFWTSAMANSSNAFFWALNMHSTPYHLIVWASELDNLNLLSSQSTITLCYCACFCICKQIGAYILKMSACMYT